jgi:hypothetical protein
MRLATKNEPILISFERLDLAGFENKVLAKKIEIKFGGIFNAAPFDTSPIFTSTSSASAFQAHFAGSARWIYSAPLILAFSHLFQAGAPDIHPNGSFPPKKGAFLPTPAINASKRKK